MREDGITAVRASANSTRQWPISARRRPAGPIPWSQNGSTGRSALPEKQGSRSHPAAAAGTSPGQRIGAKLQLDDLARRTFATLNVKWSSGAIGRPKSLSFPTRVRVINAAIHPFGIKPHGIGNAQIDKPTIHEGKQRFVGVAGGDRHVLAQPERVELVHPSIVARLGRTWLRYAGHLRSGKRIERPTLRAMFSCRVGSVQRPFEFAAIEACEMAARQRRPEHAVAVDVTSTRPVAW